MSRTAFSANIDPGTVAIVQRLAAARGQSMSDVAGSLLEQAAAAEDRLLTAGQVGLDDLDVGRTVPHDIVLRELDAMVARHRARCPD